MFIKHDGKADGKMDYDKARNPEQRWNKAHRSYNDMGKATKKRAVHKRMAKKLAMVVEPVVRFHRRRSKEGRAAV